MRSNGSISFVKNIVAKYGNEKSSWKDSHQSSIVEMSYIINGSQNDVILPSVELLLFPHSRL